MPAECATVAELRFAAMGTEAHVIVRADDPEPLLASARARLELLERRWSRFRVDSELHRLSTAGGVPTVVSRETYALIRHAVYGWGATAGRFDPTVFEAMRANGYDAPWRPGAPPVRVAPGSPAAAPGCGGIALIDDLRLVTVPPGVGLDPGGIGKGYAADLVVARLMARGAEGACVNVGGDLRVSGTSPHGGAWTLDVEDPWSARSIARLSVADGAIATTSRVRRRWDTDRGPRHHLIDPATGRPADTGLASVSVVTRDAWWAEVLAKAAYVAGPTEGASLLVEHGAAGVLVDDAGVPHLVGPIEELLA